MVGEAVGVEDLWSTEEKMIEHRALAFKGQMEKEMLIKDILQEGSEGNKQTQKTYSIPEVKGGETSKRVTGSIKSH